MMAFIFASKGTLEIAKSALTRSFSSIPKIFAFGNASQAPKLNEKKPKTKKNKGKAVKLPVENSAYFTHFVSIPLLSKDLRVRTESIQEKLRNEFGGTPSFSRIGQFQKLDRNHLTIAMLSLKSSRPPISRETQWTLKDLSHLARNRRGCPKGEGNHGGSHCANQGNRQPRRRNQTQDWENLVF